MLLGDATKRIIKLAELSADLAWMILLGAFSTGVLKRTSFFLAKVSKFYETCFQRVCIAGLKEIFVVLRG